MSTAIKCPDGRSISAHEKGLCGCKDKPQRSAIVAAMHMRFGHPKAHRVMRDRRDRRPKDARRSWKNDEG
jgi:hypothetical protein